MILNLYKYQITRSDKTFSVGDAIRPEGEHTALVKILIIVKIDAEEMIMYFYGVELFDLGESEHDRSDDV